MPPYSIRHGERADLGACIALVRLATPERSRTDWRDSLERDIGHPEHHLVVAERDGEIAGYGRARLFEPGPNAPETRLHAATTSPGSSSTQTTGEAALGQHLSKLDLTGFVSTHSTRGSSRTLATPPPSNSIGGSVSKRSHDASHSPG